MKKLAVILMVSAVILSLSFANGASETNSKINVISREEGSGTRKILEQLLYEHNHSFADFKRITTVSSFGLITKLLEKNNCITFAYRAVKGGNNALAEFRVDGFSVSREFNYVYLDTPFSQYAVEYFDSCK